MRTGVAACADGPSLSRAWCRAVAIVRRLKQASDDGLPAMAGVDHMLADALGSKYGDHDTTSWAGTFMADVMVEAGYVQTRKKPMPRGCIAKTAAFFEKC